MSLSREEQAKIVRQLQADVMQLRILRGKLIESIHLMVATALIPPRHAAIDVHKCVFRDRLKNIEKDLADMVKVAANQGDITGTTH